MEAPAAAELMKRIVTEKLSTAAAEILAAVEQVVAEYEAAAAGLTLELERQRQQMALLQPRVKVERAGEARRLLPHGHNRAFLSMRPQSFDHHLLPVSPPEVPADQQCNLEPGWSLDVPLLGEDPGWTPSGSVCSAGPGAVPLAEGGGAREEDGKDEDRCSQNDAKVDHMTPPDQSQQPQQSAVSQYSVWCPGSPWTNNLQDFVDLKIRILGKSQSNVLSAKALRKCPIVELQFPRGLQEPEFHKLLSTAFPKLAHCRADFFTCNKRQLHPLGLQTLTPENVLATMEALGVSILYIRPKPVEDVHVGQEVLSLTEKEVEEALPAAPEEDIMVNSSGKTRVRGYESCSGQPLVCQTDDLVPLRIQILEDHVDDLSLDVHQHCPIQRLDFPRGLQEDDFLHLLRCSLPQLAQHRSFDLLICSTNRRLCPLSVSALTPEEIYNTIKHVGNSTLYIRVKSPEPRREASPCLDPSAPALLQAVEGGKGGDDVGDSKSLIEEQMTVESSPLFPKAFVRTRSGRRCSSAITKPEVQRVMGNACFTCLVCGADRRTLTMLIKHAAIHCSEAKETPCGICGETVPKLLTHLQDHKKTFRCSLCKKSFMSNKSMKRHMNRHTHDSTLRSEVCSSGFALDPPLTEPPAICAVEPPHMTIDEVASSQSVSPEPRREAFPCLDPSAPALLQGVEGGKGGDDGGDSKSLIEEQMKVESSPLFQKAIVRTRSGRRCSSAIINPEVQRVTGNGCFTCLVCGADRSSLCMLIKHAAIHCGEAKETPCGVCGEVVPKLLTHLQDHTKTFSCSLCKKSFLTNKSLKKHMNRHTHDSTLTNEFCFSGFALDPALTEPPAICAVESPHMTIDEVASSQSVAPEPRREASPCLDPSAPALPQAVETGKGGDDGGDSKSLIEEQMKVESLSLFPKAFLRTRSGRRCSSAIIKPEVQRVTGNGCFTCLVCGMDRRTFSMLIKHAAIHCSEVKETPCGVCGEMVPKLLTHLEDHKKTFRCSLCKKSFMSNRSMKRHMNREVCSGGLALDPQLTEPPAVCAVESPHMTIDEVAPSQPVAPEPRGEASPCLDPSAPALPQAVEAGKGGDDGGDSKSLIEEQMKVESSSLFPKAFVRTRSGRRCSSAITNPEVQRVTGNACFTCLVCGADRSTFSMLIKHATIHCSEAKETPCGVCGEIVPKLLTHLEDHNKTFSCSLCKKSFMTYRSMKRHMSGHTHDSTLRSKVCSGGFP